ncbi:ead/Ea22-like family protein [Klebsiella sp. 20_CIP_Kleb]|uniref:ead/Ea22-like family protein n=1 Tax=Klebsiella sp. 20_CIP_Kleb TaxID=3391444 RepID=UPI003D18067A
MTDITELAQSKSLRKKLNRRLNDAYGFQRTSGGKHTTISLNIAECKSVIAALEKHLALVEALEYYKSREERVTSLVRDNSKSWDELYRQVEAKGKRNVELVEALESEKRICATWRKTAKSTGEKLEKAQTINAAAEKLVRCKGRYHSEQNYRALAALFGVRTPDLPPLDDESHAVTVENLQESAYRAGLTAGWNLGLANNNDGFNKCLAAHAAGIKVEAE